MVDPRFEAARMTDQSGGRGWDFRDINPEPSRFGLGVAVVAVLIVGLSLIASVA